MYQGVPKWSPGLGWDLTLFQPITGQDPDVPSENRTPLFTMTRPTHAKTGVRYQTPIAEVLQSGRTLLGSNIKLITALLIVCDSFIHLNCDVIQCIQYNIKRTDSPLSCLYHPVLCPAQAQQPPAAAR